MKISQQEENRSDSGAMSWIPTLNSMLNFMLQFILQICIGIIHVHLFANK